MESFIEAHNRLLLIGGIIQEAFEVEASIEAYCRGMLLKAISKEVSGVEVFIEVYGMNNVVFGR